MRLLCGAAAAVLLLGAMPASAQDTPVKFSIAAQPLADGLNEFARQSGRPVMFTPEVADRRMTHGASDVSDPELALNMVLADTGLSWRRSGDTYLIMRADTDPQSGSAAGDGADGTVEALIVTAQKREEDIQDVPIAISAFTQEALEQQKIEGGFDLLKAIPNVTFSKNNFTSYNFSIRGVGTKAISATTDPGVAVAFNNTALIQNRLFEQEYFDVERVEVLRGPQGTLYGRNATAGVINVISAKPDMNDFDGWIKGEVGNYDTKRLSAMINIPLAEDKLAIRLAGALTSRKGYDFNSSTGNAINGRDLWSGRVTVGFNPIDSVRANLIWERFEEDDDRSRTGKQLCHRDPGPDAVGDVSLATTSTGPNDWTLMRHALFSQGCKPGSLYEDSAFGTPNGLSLPPVFGMLVLQLEGLQQVSTRDGVTPVSFLKPIDPYGGAMQSRDLRTIASISDPRYRAKADVLELNVDFDLGPNLTLASQTAYDKDTVYSFQDFNRFNSQPIFEDTSDFTSVGYQGVARGGVFCDPQLGCSNRLAGFDISQAKSSQFSQELRLQSDFDGPFNFSVGANYTRFNALVDYYVFYNVLTLMAISPPFNDVNDGNPIDYARCGKIGYFPKEGDPATVAIDDPNATCPYVDPNPIESIDGNGHNYFRSKNPYRLKSAAMFGEAYWNITETLKLTAGLRYNVDRKTFTPVPSQVLLAKGNFGGGTTGFGYPEKPDIKQHWGEFTGRLGVDWKADLSFTDETLLYAFYSRGYKGGGANPPTPGFATREEALDQALHLGIDPSSEGVNDPALIEFADQFLHIFPTLTLTAAEYGPTFRPEFVNAFEVGAKNTLLDGSLTFNTGAFFYDYKDYQVSQIRDRTAVNENFDAKVWGLEFETRFAPSRDLQIVANLGYLDTRIGDGMKSIDIMDRTQGNPGWVVTKPWVQYPSNCIVPVGVAENWALSTTTGQRWWAMCGHVGGTLGAFGGNGPPIDPETNAPYDPANYPDVNGGAGFYDDIGGNELPNSPHWTANLGVQYGWDALEGWRVTVRGDAYWQSQSWARVYNDDPYDKLHGWYNANLSLWVENDEGLKIELYAKNVLNDTPITDAFLNSDDTALTTNVFVLDPRLIGLSIRKEF